MIPGESFCYSVLLLNLLSMSRRFEGEHGLFACVRDFDIFIMNFIRSLYNFEEFYTYLARIHTSPSREYLFVVLLRPFSFYFYLLPPTSLISL